jgi:myosin-5
MRPLRNTSTTARGSDRDTSAIASSASNSFNRSADKSNDQNLRASPRSSPVRKSNKSEPAKFGRDKSNPSSSKSLNAPSPRRFGSSANNWKEGSAPYLSEAKQRLRRSPSPARNRGVIRQRQVQSSVITIKSIGSDGNIPVGNSVKPKSKALHTPTTENTSKRTPAASCEKPTSSYSTSKKWTSQALQVDKSTSTRTTKPLPQNNSLVSLAASAVSSSKSTTSIDIKSEKIHDMSMQESSDQSNVWVRHSLLLNVLNPKPSYGSSSSVTSSSSLSINRPSTPLKKTPSFLKSTPYNSSSGTPNLPQKSHSFRGTPNLKSIANVNSDDASTSASTTSSGLSNNTTPPKWGWVKASILNNDAFATKKTNPAPEQTPLESVKTVPWKKQLKSYSQAQAPPVTPTKPIPERPSVAPVPAVVSLKIIDLESEFHGQTIDVPLSMIPGHGKDNKGGNGTKSIFGDCLVMANAWTYFTRLPEKSVSVEPITTPSRPKSKWSSYGKKTVEEPEEKKCDSADEDSQIPSDLTNLTHLHEPAVVFSLRHRYALNEIYTATGPILLALNPFKEVKGIYGDELMKQYSVRGQGLMNGVTVKNKSSERNAAALPPHVYAVADNAFRAMMRAMEDASVDSMSDEHPNQSILVSGESGAGKTVTTKIIMKYLANLSKRSGAKKVEKKPISSRWDGKPQNFSSPPGVASPPISPRGRNTEQRVLESNPILESFGNARTIRNDNSSRFGKYIEIKFTSSGKLMGASVDSYLLEKVRLINQAEGERNYHIFYELLTGASGSDRQELLLGRSSPQDFIMTTSASETYKRRDGVRDDTTFGSLRKAMVTMGFDSSDQKEILRIVSSLLHLSNITFTEDSSGCSLNSNNTSLNPALQLLGVSGKALERALCCVNIEAGGEKVVKRLFLDQAIKAKEALIKATYAALFTYLVQRINNCISGGIANADSPDETGAVAITAGFIGVLDIFGFESFEKNSFEQLCINYCNESLQQQFNRFVFKLEQAEYEREGIQWNFIAFPDNQNVLDSIDKKRTGILSILDEQSFLTQCTDQSFANLVYRNCGGTGRPSKGTSAFSANSQQMAHGAFSINHYAGPVEYDTKGFLEKNKDELPKEIDDLLHSSENAFLRQLATVMNSDSQPNENSDAGRTPFKQNSLKRITVGGQFSSQLQLLRKRIDATSPHYIRCLKPNDKLEPDNFDSAVIADQLRCAGILEAVRVSRVGYPQRYLHERFVQRYQVLAMKELNLRRKDASTNFTSPVGFGFHGGFIPKNERPTPTRVKAPTEKRLNPEQECKILVAVVARQLLAANQKGTVPDDEENTPPTQSGNTWVSPGKMKKQSNWSTPGSSKYGTPVVSKKKQELNLMELGIQMGKTKVFLRQHAFEVLEVMRNIIKSEAATVLNSIFRMHLKRRRFIVMRNEYRARVAQRNRMIQEGRVVNEDFLKEAANASFEHANKFDFSEMDQITVHRESDDRTSTIIDFKWVMVDNRWIKNAGSEEIEED